jgi:CRISPR-associated protein Cmr1
LFDFLTASYINDHQINTKSSQGDPMRSVIQADYSITTPLFIGDAEQNATDITAASIKGALRFYWRAMQWGRFKTAASSDEVALKTLHQKEGKLFGSSAEQGTGQAKFNLRVSMQRIPPVKADWPKKELASGYLGIGLWSTNKTDARQYMEEGHTFSIRAVLHPSLSEADSQTLKDCMILWGLIGGLGSRSRRAFGSVAIKKLDDLQFDFKSLDDYQAAVQNVLKNYPLAGTQPPYSAFSKKAMIAIHPESAASARMAHGNLGQLFKQHRGNPSSLRGSKKRVFGLPLKNIEEKLRRGSPLLMHIHPIGQYYHPVCTFLPADFHHDLALESVDYQLIRDFLLPFKEVSLV